MACSSNSTLALVERALQAEMTEHLGHDKHDVVTNATGIPAMAKAIKPSKANLANSLSKYPVTVTAAFTLYLPL
jgi:hypothetical protein